MRVFLQEHAAHLAAWSQIALAVFALGGLVALAVIWRRWTATRPERRWLLVVGAGTALWFVVSAGILLAVARGPMSPLVRTARNLQALLGRPFPDTSFKRVSDGALMRLADFRGRTVLVDLWATWCPPCRAELPTLDRLQNAYAGRGLVVITLSDEPRQQLAPVLEELTTATVNGAVESFGWLATMSNFRPFCVVIDRDGVLRDYAFGVTDYDVFERKVRRVLE
jgi:thiol-disulfide isomerase/thioredoxin